VGHTDYAVCLAYIPPGRSQDYPNGAIASGEGAAQGQACSLCVASQAIIGHARAAGSWCS